MHTPEKSFHQIKYDAFWYILFCIIMLQPTKSISLPTVEEHRSGLLGQREVNLCELYLFIWKSSGIWGMS